MFADGRGSLGWITGRIANRIIPAGRPFYGWRLVVAVAVIAALGNGELVDQAFEGYWLPGWHLLKLPTLLMPAAGWLIARRWGPRRAMLTGLPIVGIGLLAAGLWGAETGYLVALAPVAIGATLGGWLPAATIINDHFRRRPATAQAMLLFGGADNRRAAGVWAVAAAARRQRRQYQRGGRWLSRRVPWYWQ